MFKCDRCGSRYSSMHAATIENCPRCLVRERVSSPLALKLFQSPPKQAAPDYSRPSAGSRAG